MKTGRRCLDVPASCLGLVVTDPVVAHPVVAHPVVAWHADFRADVPTCEIKSMIDARGGTSRPFDD